MDGHPRSALSQHFEHRQQDKGGRMVERSIGGPAAICYLQGGLLISVKSEQNSLINKQIQSNKSMRKLTDSLRRLRTCRLMPSPATPSSRGKFGRTFRIIYNNSTMQNQPIKNQDQESETTECCARNPKSNFELIVQNNKKWAQESVQKDPEFFSRLVSIQSPQFLWIGCSDSRVPANEIVGLKPGELFVHRNVANQVPPSDINVLAVIQYSVQVLKVKDIIVTGHYGCGGIKAAFRKHDHGPLEAWLSHVRDIRARYKKALIHSDDNVNEDLLTELNVKTQVYNVSKIPIVQLAWKNGQELRIHGFVYDLRDGLLKDLGITLDSLEKIPEEYRVVQ